VKDSATKKYYSIAGTMVATQDASGLQYLLTDHLGSTVAVTNASGTLTSQQRYLPFGGTRAIPNSPILGTDFGYTGQRLLDSGMGGIMDYKARFYSIPLGRFQQPDTIIPGRENPGSWNRYTYVGNNPITHNDPDGRCYPLCTMLVGAAVGAIVSVTAYAVMATFTGQEITPGGLAGAALGGAIVGAVSGIAGPVAGTALKAAQITVTATSSAVGTAVINGAAGAVAYVASTKLTNAIDVPRGKDEIPVTWSGMATSAALNSGFSLVASVAYPIPLKSGQYTLKHAMRFAPGRTWKSLFASENADNVYRQVAYSNALGTISGTMLALGQQEKE
jgi:RHS repeat-associated protein